MAKRNIITDSNGDKMTETQYAATLDITKHQAYVGWYIANHGNTENAVLDVACSLPDYCAFEIEVDEAFKRGDISEACQRRLWKMGHDVWMWFEEFLNEWGLTLEDTQVFNECWR